MKTSHPNSSEVNPVTNRVWAALGCAALLAGASVSHAEEAAAEAST